MTNNTSYNPFLVYCRELAPGTVSLTGDRAKGDDSKHDSHYNSNFPSRFYSRIVPEYEYESKSDRINTQMNIVNHLIDQSSINLFTENDATNIPVGTLPQNALRRDCNGKCIEIIEGHYLEVVVLLYTPIIMR